MPTHYIFLNIVIILLAARLFGEIASRIKIPPVVGELMAGIVLGPSLLGLIEPGEVLHLLAEIGIIMLLFEVGLDTDVSKLVRAGSKAVVVAFSGFILPFRARLCGEFLCLPAAGAGFDCLLAAP